MVRTVNKKGPEGEKGSRASRSPGKTSGRRQAEGRRQIPDREEQPDQEKLTGLEQAPPSAMNFRMVIFMVAGIVTMTALLIFYIKLQADVTRTSREIANLEQQLSEMKSENDAAYNEINDRISLEEVRDRAINELGMKYADRDQVVIYSGTEEDSVQQVSDVEGR